MNNFKKAAQEFMEAAIKLNRAWEDNDIEESPFDKDFESVTNDIINWYHNIEEESEC